MKSEEVCKLVVDNRNILLACALAGWQTLETWLGKTTRVRAGSVPEAIYNGVKSLLVKKETTMEKAYDLKDLVSKINIAEVGEEAAKQTAIAVLDWLKESATISSTPFDNILIPVLDMAKPKILEELDKINPNG